MNAVVAFLLLRVVSAQRDSIYGSSYQADAASTGSFYIYDWPGVSPGWIGNNVFQWSLATHGYGRAHRVWI
jgi:hypothetical protein